MLQVSDTGFELGVVFSSNVNTALSSSTMFSMTPLCLVREETGTGKFRLLFIDAYTCTSFWIHMALPLLDGSIYTSSNPDMEIPVFFAAEAESRLL